MPFHDEWIRRIHVVSDRAWIRASAGGEKLSEEALSGLAALINQKPDWASVQAFYMTDPDLVLPADYEFYTSCAPPAQGWPKRDTPAQLKQALDKAHDNIRRLVRYNDLLTRNQAVLAAKLEKERKWRQLLITALGLTWVSWGGAFWFLFKWAAPLIVKGLGR